MLYARVSVFFFQGFLTVHGFIIDYTVYYFIAKSWWSFGEDHKYICVPLILTSSTCSHLILVLTKVTSHLYQRAMKSPACAKHISIGIHAMPEGDQWFEYDATF